MTTDPLVVAWRQGRLVVGEDYERVRCAHNVNETTTGLALRLRSLLDGDKNM